MQGLSQCLALVCPAAPQTQSCHLTESQTLVANVDLIAAGGSSRLLLVRFVKQLIGESCSCSPSASAMGLDAGGSRRQRIASQHGALQQTDDEMKEACLQNAAMHQGRNLRIVGLVDPDGSDTALSPGRRARTGICNKAAASPAASSLSSGSHRFIVGGWSVCLTQSTGRYLESGCRAGWQTRDEGDFRCNNLVRGQSSGWLATRYGACCATTEMQPILCCSSGESSN